MSAGLAPSASTLSVVPAAVWRPAAREVFLAVGVVAGLTAATLLVSWFKLPVDLEVYRRGGQGVLSGFDQIYVSPPRTLPFTYPPLSALLFVPLTAVPPLVATVVVTALSFASLYFLVVVARRHVLASHDMPRLQRVPTAALVLAAAAAEPVAATVGFGQVNLVLAALIVADLLIVRGRWSGILLGLAIGIKVTPAVFLLLPLLRGDWATVRRSVVTVVLGVVLPMLVVPQSGLTFWMRALWDADRVGGVAYAGNQSIEGGLWRASGPGGVPLVRVLLCVIVVALAIQAVRSLVRTDAFGALLAAAVAGLLVSPISWSHHWVWVVLLVPWLILYSRGTFGQSRTLLHRLSLGLGVAWVVAGMGWVVRYPPAGDGQEYFSPVLVKVLADTYLLLGLASLVVLVLAGQARPHQWDGAAQHQGFLREPPPSPAVEHSLCGPSVDRTGPARAKY